MVHLIDNPADINPDEDTMIQVLIDNDITRESGLIIYGKYGDPNGNRTRVYAVKGRRPGPLDDGVT